MSLRTHLGGVRRLGAFEAAAALCAVLLGWNNLFVPVLPTSPAVRAAVNVAGVALLVAAARRGGIGPAELGLSRRTWRAGACWGGAALGVAVAGYAVVLAVPALRPLLQEPRVASAPVGELLVRALFAIPVGTVVCEELAFRGVLQALAERALTPRWALALIAVTFAGWHVASGVFSPLGGAPAVFQRASLVGVLLVTGVGGLVLAGLRRRTGSLLAPLGVHLGTNGVGLIAAILATR